MRRLLFIAIVALTIGSWFAGLADRLKEAMVGAQDRATEEHGSFEVCPPATSYARYRQPVK